MHFSHNPDQPTRPIHPVAKSAPGPAALSDLIDRARRLRDDVAALRGSEPDSAPDHRVQRAVWGLAVRHLEDAAGQLAQLGAGSERRTADGPASDCGGGEGAGGRIGSAEWSLTTDGVVWTEELYGLFGRSLTDGPLTLDELPSYLVEEDRPALTTAVTGCLIDGRTVECEFRVRRTDGERRVVQLVGEPVLDDAGGTVAMWAVLRDLTDLRPIADAGGRGVAGAPDTNSPGADPGGGTGTVPPGNEPEELARTVDTPPVTQTAEWLVAGLREAGPELWLGPADRPRPAGERGALELAAACVPAASPAAAEGKWYDWLDLPSGETVLSMGDLSGHGAAAAAATVGTLGALRGLALTGAPPGQIMDHLNVLVDSSARPTLGSAFCCLYRPADAELTWAQAGHPAPLLCRRGTGRILPRPSGTLLGAAEDTVYGERSDRLQRGDTLVLLTDGLFTAGQHGRFGRAGRGTPQLLALAPKLCAASSARDALDALLHACAAPNRPGDACVLVARVG